MNFLTSIANPIKYNSTTAPSITLTTPNFWFPFNQPNHFFNNGSELNGQSFSAGSTSVAYNDTYFKSASRAISCSWAGGPQGANWRFPNSSTNSVGLGSSGFTLCFWFYLIKDVIQNNSYPMLIYWDGQGGGIGKRFYVGFTPNGTALDSFVMECGYANTSSQNGVFILPRSQWSSIGLALNKWMHVAWTVDTSGNWTVLINGTQINLDALNSQGANRAKTINYPNAGGTNFAMSSVTSNGTSTENCKFYFFQEGNSGGTGQVKWGDTGQGQICVLDDVRFYKPSITSTEILYLYNNGI